MRIAASKFSALAAGRLEVTCNVFNAQQVNRILLAMKKLLDKDAGFALPLVSETGEQSYRDVCLLLHDWLDLCADRPRQAQQPQPEILHRQDDLMNDIEVEETGILHPA